MSNGRAGSRRSLLIRYYVATGAGNAAAQAVNDNFSTILSVSFGRCEAQANTATANFYNSTFNQAATQGITVFVSSGDSGAAMCDSLDSTTGTVAAVNVICTPAVTCVGGTQFADTASPSSFWSASNDSTTHGSALSYIPEAAWNESASGGLHASGGGVSTIFARGTWQTAPGVASGSTRLMPDLAAAAAGHTPYVIYQGGSLGGVLGTSAAAPSVAGVFALIGQRLGRMGSINQTLYQIGNAQYSGTGATVFHDITIGTNTVPGVNGFNCGVGYDMVTGLGSIDASALMNVMSGSAVTPPPTGPCVANATTACVLNNRFKVTVRYRGAFDNNAADTDANVKSVTGFASPTFETAFFYFGNPNNIEMLLKMLDQGNTNGAGQPTIAVLFGSATPLRIELTITDTTTGTVKQYTSAFNTQAGQTDFTAFVK